MRNITLSGDLSLGLGWIALAIFLAFGLASPTPVRINDTSVAYYATNGLKVCDINTLTCRYFK